MTASKPPPVPIRPLNPDALASLDRFMQESGRLQQDFARTQSWLADAGRFAAALGGLVAKGGRVVAGKGLSGLDLEKASLRAAETERILARLATADATGETRPHQVAGELGRLAHRMAMPVAELRASLESLVASGHALPKAMALLPAMAGTAQTSGVAMGELAKAADALAGTMDIDPGRMQAAFDIMAMGGRRGALPLKEMVSALPELAPLARDAGLRGTEGLTGLVAMLHGLRRETGSSGVALARLKAVISAMTSAETGEAFEGAGVNLPKALEKARKDGKSLLDVLIDLTQTATRGELSRLPRFFEDGDAQAGMRALIRTRQATASLATEIGRTADGTIGRDLDRVLNDSEARITRLAVARARLSETLGGIVNRKLEETGILTTMADGLNKLSDALERNRVLQRQLDEAGIKPVPRLKTVAEAKAEEVLAEARAERETAERIARSQQDFPDGGFHRGSTEGRGKPGRAHLARTEASNAESRRLMARDPAARAKEAEEIAKGGGETEAASRVASLLSNVQRKRGNTRGGLYRHIEQQEKRLGEILSAFAFSRKRQAAGGIGLTPPEEARRLEEAKALLGEILYMRRQLDGGTEPTQDEIDNHLAQRRRALEQPESDRRDTLKDKHSAAPALPQRQAALDWTRGASAGIPDVAAGIAALRAPIMTPPAIPAGAGQPAPGGTRAGPAAPASVQVGGIHIHGVQDPERAARIAESRLASAITRSLSGAHHDGVV